jgi:hypothetical protein
MPCCEPVSLIAQTGHSDDSHCPEEWTSTVVSRTRLAGMLGDAGIDRALGTIKLRAGFEQIER